MSFSMIRKSGLRVKLVALAVLATILLLILAGANRFTIMRIENSNQAIEAANQAIEKANQAIEKANAKKQVVNQTVKDVMGARLIEKTYLQFFTTALKEQFDRQSQLLESELQSLQEKAVLDEFQEYRELFNEAVNIHLEHAALKLKLVEPLKGSEIRLKEIIAELEDKQSRLLMEGEDLSGSEMEMMNVARDCQIVFLKLQNIQQQFLSGGDEKYIKDFKALASGEVHEYIDALVEFANAMNNESFIQKSGMVAGSIDEFMALINQSLGYTSRENELRTLLNEKGENIIAAAEALLMEADKLVAVEKQKAGQARQGALAAKDAAESAKAMAALIIYTVVIVGIVVFLFFSWLIIRSITKPIKAVVNFADTVQKGDLSTRLHLDLKDEIGRMAGALDLMADALEAKAGVAADIANGDLTKEIDLASEKDTLGIALREMIADLNQVVGQVNQAVSQVASGSNQVSESSQALSEGATEQAASIEEITASMGELGSQTKKNAANAAQANQLSLNARDAANKGDTHMQEMIAAMGQITESSKEIAKIIKAIDDIAFQTNLLALNAAVESARAGKHGKGFAVVAQEVRGLASRSAKAAQETTELIEGAMKKVENGTVVVNRTAEVLEEIHDSVNKVTELVSEIAEASNEQALGIAQINEGLDQIDQVTQQNTASAEETAAASEELSSLASNLRQIVSRFRLKEQADEPIEAIPKAPQPRRLLPQADMVMDSWGGQAAPSVDMASFDDKGFSKH